MAGFFELKFCAAFNFPKCSAILVAAQCQEFWGGTRVSRVKSGVPLNFVGGLGLPTIFQSPENRTSHDGFGRDARNDRRDACATHSRLDFARRSANLFA
jgi:hypothetical protein